MASSNQEKRQIQLLESLHPSSHAPASSSRASDSSSRAPLSSSRASDSSSSAPASKSHAPDSSLRAPCSSSRAPSSSFRAPATSSRALDSSPSARISKSRAPDSSFRAPSSSSRAPSSSSRAPSRSSPAPSSSSLAPSSSSRAPDSSFRAPSSSSRAPSSSSRAPSRSSPAPSSSSLAPSSSSRAPSSSFRAPSSSSRAPSSSSRAPSRSSPAPSSSSLAASSSSRAPDSSFHAPSSSSRALSSSSRAPSSSSRAPSRSSRAPARLSRASASSSPAPASSSRAPASSSRAPASSSRAPDSPSRGSSSSSRALVCSSSAPSTTRRSVVASGETRGRKRCSPCSSNDQRTMKTPDHLSAKRPRYSPLNMNTDFPRKSSQGKTSMRSPDEKRKGEFEKQDVETRKRKNDENRCEEARKVKRTDSMNSADNLNLSPRELSREVKPISFTALKNICEITKDDEAMLEISKMEERYIALLNSTEEIREDLFKLVVDSLTKILHSNNRPTQVVCILRQTHQKFIGTHLTPFILELSDKRDENDKYFEEVILKLVAIIEGMLQRIPAEVVYSVPIFQLEVITKQFHEKGLVTAHVKDRIEKAKALWVAEKSRICNKGLNAKPPNDFRELSVVPVYKDFGPGTKPFLRANVIGNAYNDVEHYLDVQFRLLREDLIIPLRDGVKQLRREKRKSETGSQSGQEASKKRRNVQLFVYQDVKILNPVCNCEGGVYRIRINISHPALRHVRWGKSKRLKFGALVCLSPDSFQSLYFGAVEERDPADLNYGELQIRFDNCSWELMRHFIEDKTRFEMVESESYFEAYRHNLSALQKLTDKNLPFKEYIVFGNKNVSPPKYLVLQDAEKEPKEEEEEEEEEIEKVAENAKDDGVLSEGELDPRIVYFDLKTICDPGLEDHDQNMSHVPVLDLNQWPIKEALGLDASQYRACQLALTNRFALIQGPPGTGKTYVGLKIAHALLDNRDVWGGGDKSPILMVSYTNHALDQFLMGLNNKEGMVRVGGRSRQEELYNFNLKMLRRRSDLYLLHQREQKAIRRKIEAIESTYLPKEAVSLLAQSDKAVLSVKKLEEFMKPEHFKALKPDESQKCSYFQMNKKLLRWLGIKIDIHSQDQARKQHDKQYLENVNKLFSFKEYTDEDIEVIDTEQGKFVTACHIDDAVEPEKLRNCLKSHRIMDDREANRIDDIWSLRLRNDERWRLYRLWRDRLETNCQKRIRDSQDAGYETELKKLQESKKDVDLRIFQDSRVIGMTTSCAARYHSLLQRVKPKIVIVEEAAEVLEAHILTSLPLDCEHVILIGDHQQLRPSCTVYELAKKYNLNISMFERMVKLQMPCVRLSEQHRMRPEIASLMRHIYKDLQDHPSVKKYDSIQGVQHNIFLIDHRHQEDDSEDSFSHLNKHEAQFVLSLCRYLVQQGYGPSQMTILTPYLGQMFLIRDCMTSPGDEDLRKQTRLTTIDNYQGEENDIILLSLVRSNDTGHVGFVNDMNRACVALSRARMGLYVIGNFELLATKSDIWKKVVNDLKKRGEFGEELPLKCQSHNSKILVKEPKDFLEKVPCGGCDVPCLCRLECGHTCKLSCHPYDKEHKEFKCLEKCARTIIGCKNGHPCEKECWEPCDLDCNYPVDKLLSCGHTKENVRCSASTRGLKCDVRCEKKLECGHQCQAKCGQSCTEVCQELVKRRDWPCGHDVTIACSATPFDCPGPCGVTRCGHECSGHCGECLQGRVHRRCKKTCGRVLVCGHECTAKCTITCPPCTKECQTKCKHSECREKCGKPCVPCRHECEWACEHLKCNMKCGEICDRPRCNEPCRKRLQCKHICRGLCNELCICVECERSEIQVLFGTEDFDDETVRFVQLKECKHIIEVSALDHWMDQTHDDSEENHSIQPKVCPCCKTPIRTTMRYNNVIKKQQEDIERVKAKILEPFSQDQKVKVLRKLIIESSDKKKSGAAEVLFRKVGRATQSLELHSIENQVELLTRCRRLIKKADEMKDKTTDKTSVEVKDLSWGISVLEYLKEKRIVNSVEREIEDIELEVRRQKVVIEMCSLLTETTNRGIPLAIEHRTLLDDIRSKLSQAASMKEKSALDSYIKKLEEIRSKYPIDPPTREEKNQIIKVMGLSKGHWYKCRQGHVYAIGECGGAMERGKCPECHGEIGGTSHRLAEGNEVATEMDGARYSAWSEQANMENYDLQDLQD